VRTVSNVAAIVLGAVFVLAGGSKVAMGKRWPLQATQLGVPVLLAQFVPWIELAVGALLIVQLFEPGPALAAIWLLLAFTALITKRLAEGKHPTCACFGTWSAKPIGPAHLVRNTALLVLGMLALYA
jgi:uncharacterized membrane protein YphA (DoxX/SURF4 family)